MVRLTALLFVCFVATSVTSAQVPLEQAPTSALRVDLSGAAPAAAQAKRHTYLRLRKKPLVALGYDALLPGAGSWYDGIYVHAVVSFTVSFVGAGLWTVGAILQDDRLWWSGAVCFGVGRAYGLVAAPLGAALLNAVFRRQLRVAYRF